MQRSVHIRRLIMVAAVALTGWLVGQPAALGQGISSVNFSLTPPPPGNFFNGSITFRPVLPPNPGVSVDTVAMKMSGSMSTFFTPLSGFMGNVISSDSSWSALDIQPQHVDAHRMFAGTSTQMPLNFQLVFSDYPSQNDHFLLELVSFDNGVRNGYSTLQWLNGLWIFKNYPGAGNPAIPAGAWLPEYDDLQVLVIPLPAPVWTGLVGLLGVAILRRRRLLR